MSERPTSSAFPLSSHVGSWYAATANRHDPHPRLETEIDCDVCVVGGGFTGLMAALNLAERGFDTVLLEAERVGWGASGRCGGQIVSGFNRDVSEIATLVGRDDAQRLWTLAEQAKAILRSRIQRHAIACDLRPGMVYAATKRRHLTEIARWHRDWTETLNYPHLTPLDREQMRAQVDSPAYLGGLIDADGGQLHPLNYVLGLADAAAAAGVRLFEASRVLAAAPGDGRTRAEATTEHGRVRARWLVLATNGYHAPLSRPMERGVMPVLTYMVATAPLSQAAAEALIPGDMPVCDLNFATHYFRRTKDHRLIFGGGVSYSQLPALSPKLASGLRVAQVFPQLRETALDYCWGGTVAITRNRLPQFGRLGPNTLFAHGYSGHGVALTALAGTLIADAIAGDAEGFDVFTRIPHKPFPGGRWLRLPALVAAMAWYRLRDRLG